MTFYDVKMLVRDRRWKTRFPICVKFEPSLKMHSKLCGFSSFVVAWWHCGVGKFEKIRVHFKMSLIIRPNRLSYLMEIMTKMHFLLETKLVSITLSFGIHAADLFFLTFGFQQSFYFANNK